MLYFLQRNLTYTIPLFMIGGLFFGYFLDPSFLKAFIMPLTFLMVYPMMVNLQIRKVFSKGDGKVQVATQVLNFLVIPFIAFGIGIFFFPESPLLALGLLLTALLPTSGMTISWTGFARGNINAAIKMTVIGLVAGSLATPLYAKWLMGTVIEIPLMDVFRQIVIIVFLPMVAGYVTQRLIISWYGEAKYHKDIKNKFPMLSTLGVLGIVFVAMSLKAKTVIADPSVLLSLLIPLMILYLVNFAISTAAGKFLFERGDGIALVYGTVMRNLSIALAIAMTVFGEQGSEIALIIAMAYIIQVQAAAWYVKFNERIFGPVPEDTAGDLMQEGVFALHDTESLQDAIRMLSEEHIHSIGVLDEKEGLKGVLSAEMVVNFLAENIPVETHLRDLNLRPVVKCKNTCTIQKVLKTMKKTHQYKVIVTDAAGKPKGVLTETDLAAREVI
ncbi:MAG: bile acid:sodium symporter [Candidatus Woesearchaeota archaeon]